MAGTSQTSVMVTIGAALSSAYDGVFNRATSKLKAVGGAIEQLKGKAARLDELRQSEQRAAGSVEKLTAYHEKARAAMTASGARVTDLKAKMAAMGAPTDANAKALATFATRLDSAETSAARAATRFAGVDAQLQQAKAGFAAVSAEAQKFAAENAHVGASLERLSVVTARSNAAHAAVEENLQRRQKYQQGMLGVVAMGAGLYTVVRQAAEMQEKRFPLRIGLALRGLSERDVSESIDTAREFARRNPVSLQTVLDVQLGMTQRGMAPEFAKKMSGFVANVGALTGQEGTATATVVGEIYDAIGSRMQGSSEQRIRKIGDIIAQTKFQFGMELAPEGLRKSLQAANRLNIGLEELVTVMGTLKRAGFDENSSGQATEQLLTKLTAASQKYGFQIVRNTDGGMDWYHTLRNLRQEIGTQVGAQGLEAVDAAFGEIAGPKGKSAITALFTAVSGANAFGAELAKLRESGGFVDKTAKEKLAEAGAQLEKLKENLNSIGAVIGGVLLPGFSRLLAPVGRFSAALAKFSQEHKTIGAVIGTTAAAALTFGAAIFAVGYAMTYIRAPFLAFRAWLRDTEKNAVGASIALHAMAAAQREAAGAGTVGALGAATATRQGLLGRTFARITGRGAVVAGGAAVGEAATTAAGSGSAIASIGSAIGGLSAGPLLVIGAAIVAIGVAVYKFWQPIGAFFSGLWAGIGQGLAPVGTAIREAFAPLKPVFDEASKLFSGLFEQVGLSSEGFKKAFGAGLWWGQKFGSVIGAVLTTVIHLIAFAISSVLTLGQVLADLGKGKPGAAWEHAKAWWKESGMHGKAIGGAWEKIFEAPDYSAVGKAGDDLRAAEERKNAQSALKQKANQQRARGVELESQAKALHEKIEVFGDPTGSLGAALIKLQAAIDANTRELKQTEYRMEHPEPAAASAQPSAQSSAPKVVGAAMKHLAKAAGIPHASSHRLSFHHLSKPRMAEGGVAERATNVIFGEAGPEAIIPLRRPATLMLIGAALAAAMPTPRPIAVPQNAPVFNLEQYLPRRPESREAGPTYSITNQITVQADGANTKDVGRVVADEVERRIEKLMHGAEARRRGALKN